MLPDIFLKLIRDGFATKEMSLACGWFALGGFSITGCNISHNLILSCSGVPPETDPTPNTDELYAPTGISQNPPHVPASRPPMTCGHSEVCDHKASSECPGFPLWFSLAPGSLFLCLSWKTRDGWRMKFSSWIGVRVIKSWCNKLRLQQYREQAVPQSWGPARPLNQTTLGNVHRSGW